MYHANINEMVIVWQDVRKSGVFIEFHNKTSMNETNTELESAAWQAENKGKTAKSFAVSKLYVSTQSEIERLWDVSKWTILYCYVVTVEHIFKI